MGGNGVLGARGCVGLAAVATGVLQRVPAALLLLHAQASGQDHGKSAGGRGERLTMLRDALCKKCMSFSVNLHNLCRAAASGHGIAPCWPSSLGQFSLGGRRRAARQSSPADWAELQALSSCPQTPSSGGECWPTRAHRKWIWPSPGAAEGQS